jgi:hypothetical protein
VRVFWLGYKSENLSIKPTVAGWQKRKIGTTKFMPGPKTKVDETKQKTILGWCAASEKRLKEIQSRLRYQSGEEDPSAVSKPRLPRPVSFEAMQEWRTVVEDEPLQLLQAIGTLVGLKTGDKIKGGNWVAKLLGPGLQRHCAEEVRKRAVDFVRVYCPLVDKQIVSARVNTLCNASKGRLKEIQTRLGYPSDEEGQSIASESRSPQSVVLNRCKN